MEQKTYNKLELETLKLSLPQQVYDDIADGKTCTVHRELKGYWCKRIKGLGLVCPYTLPMGRDLSNRMCQMHGKPCLSGCVICQKAVEIRRGNGKQSSTYDIKSLSVNLQSNAMGRQPRDVIVMELITTNAAD